MTSKQEIRDWLTKGQEYECTHVVIVCDTFDYSDYPVYVHDVGNVEDVVSYYDGRNMQKVMEVYSLSLSIEDQLSEKRAFHF